MSPIEDSYPLSPMQAGMLFHSLYAPRAGVDIEQMVCGFEEALDAPRLRAAWAHVVAACPVLRTSFRWQGLDEPLQDVHRDVEVPWLEEDLRASPPAEQEARLRAFLAEDRAQGFDPARAPLMRLALFRTGDALFRFVFTFHHILLDGGSFPLVIADVFSCYDALGEGRPPSLPARRPFRDFVAWLRARDTRASESFWRSLLRGFSAPTPLLGARAEARSVEEIAYGERTLQLSTAERTALVAFGRRHRVTLNTILQGAWSILLSRYSGEPSVVFGATRACRRSALDGEGADSMVGVLMNTLPMRADVRPDATVVDLLRQLGDRGRALRDHEHTPLVEVRAWSELPPGGPLFESLFVFGDKSLDTTLKQQGGAWERRRFKMLRKTNFPLVVIVYGEEELSFEIEYDRRRFDDAAVDRAVVHLATLLRGLAEDPDRLVGDLVMVHESAPEEAHPGLGAEGLTIPELFEAQAQGAPDVVAVTFDAAQLSYGALDRRAGQLAGELCAHGVGPDVPVGLCLERSIELVLAVVAVFKAGGAYLSLDPEYPADRLAFMMTDARPPVLLTQASLRGVVPPAGAAVHLLDAGWERLAGAPVGPLRAGLSPEDLAYVLYTSGSTGRPKGVAMTQRALVNLIHWQRAASPGAFRTLQFASSSFDVCFQEIFSTFFAGGTLVVIREDARRDPVQLRRRIAEDRVERLFMPPAALYQLAEALPEAGSLREVIAAGEALQVGSRVAQLFEATGAALRNQYGPSETHVVTEHLLCGSPSTWPALPPIGEPIHGVRGYLLDDRLNLVPMGARGALYFGGAQLARGYLGRPELTAERFLPDPFSCEPGARMYQTGDVGRRLPSGGLEFHGRADLQVKIRGFRVELGEVEAVLSEHDRVKDAVVVAREDTPGDRRLAAYVTTRGGELSARALRSFLEGRLPGYMVPAAFVFLDVLPLTPSGKVNRLALPVPAEVEERTEVPPRGPVEEALAGIFAEVLGISPERVGAHDGFFELGGHSLLAAKAVSRVRAAFALELAVRALFDAPTVAELAPVVEATRREGTRGAAPPISRSLEAPVLSFAQQRLWVLDQLEPDDPTYVVFRAARLRGALDRAALERALTEVVRRHEVLRTTLASAGGEPLASVQPPAPVLVPVASLCALPEAAREVALSRALASEAARPFELAAGPLLRARLFELPGGREHVLVLSMHHIASDAWTLGVLGDELGALYGALLRGCPSPLPELPIQYADYARWQRRWLSGEVLERELRYWQAKLAGAPQALELPSDRPRPAVLSHRGGRALVSLAAELAGGLRELCRREGVTLFMTLLAAFDALLARYTGQDDLLVGTPIANRARAETEVLCGFFLNTLVLRATLTPDRSFRALLHDVREVALEAYAHQDLPFERLVQGLAPERERSRSPLFQVMFTLQSASSGTFALPGLESSPVAVEIATSKFDLTLVLTERLDTIAGFFEYAAELFEASTVERFAAHYTTLLAGVVAAPEAPVAALPLLPAEERGRLLLEWNDTAYAHPADACIHEIFAAQAARTPDAVALVHEGHAASYRVLDERANQLAHALRRRAVGPDVLVGLLFERSVELLIAVYGVLKAGGAYVPIDPSLPEERVAFMVEDAALAVVVTGPLAERPPVAPRHELYLGEAADEPSSAPPRGGLTLEHLAYVIYTSGSTGRPKGAMNAHRGILNRLLWMQRAYELSAADSVLQKTPYSFDVSVWELFWPLMFGARLVIARPGGHRDPSYLTQVMAEEGITTVHFVPSMLAAFLGEPTIVRCQAVRRVICSGEALPVALADRLFARLPSELHNLYGPTEAAVDVTAWACQPGASAVPIGRPIDNVRIYILDARLSPSPIGVAGELFIAGVQVGRGYLGRPALTAERYVCDPFQGAGARMYRTGDVARWLPSGAIEYQGRSDFQVKIRGFRVELGEIESALGKHPAVLEAVVVAAGEPRRLVAYLVCGGAAPTAGELGSFLGERLPEHMVPSAFMLVPALPLTPSGKVDRRALPAPDQGERVQAASAYAAPESAAEAELARIWAAVLGLPRVGVHDNFFEIGGDSILAIQIVARAGQAGLALTPRQMFEHQTVAELARAAGTLAATVAEQGPVTGPVPLSPIARSWLEGEPREVSFYNQAFLLEPSETLSPAALEQAIAGLCEHHDALRVRLSRGASGWTQRFAEPGGPVPFACVSLAHLPEPMRRAAIERAAVEAQASLDVEHGPALRVVLLDLGEGRAQRLMLAIHHLAVDGVSWRILFEDLWALVRGRACPPKTTSFQRWATLLEEHARSETVLRGAAYSAAGRRARGGRIPLDLAAGEDTEASTQRVVVELSAEETEALLREVPDAYGTRINDVLLAALAEALSSWTGSPEVLIDLEGHGREEIFAGVDVTRTVGWFTVLYPVALHHDAAAGPGERLKSIKEQLRAVPGNGASSGLLRCSVAEEPRAELIFNYLGQVDQVLPEGAPFRLAAESSGPTQSPFAVRAHLVEVIGRVAGGRLRVRFTYSENRHRQATIAAFAARFVASLRALVEHASSKEAGGYTPSDFRRVRLSQQAIDRLAGLADGGVPRHKNVEDIYPLSPLQAGLLFHSMLSERRDTYLVQLAWSLTGALDVAAFADAWRAVLSRHASLRAAVVAEGLDASVQVVHRSVRLPLEVIDLSNAPGARVEGLLGEDRRRGFDLARPPLLRLTLIRLRADHHRFVWSMHHLILDGWSLPIILGEVLAHYEAASEGRELRLPAPRPYGEYVDWLAAQDRAHAAAFFRAELHEVTAPTPLGVDHPVAPGARERFGEARHALSEDESSALTAFARRRRLTLSTLVQGAWALLLSRYSGEHQVVFGVTVSGRSAPLSGIDAMVGLFINTIPVRVAADRDAVGPAWLEALQEKQARLRELEHTPLVDAQAQSGVPRGTPLFESLLVFENYPEVDALRHRSGGLALSELSVVESPAYPLTVVASMRRSAAFRISYDARRFDAATIERMIGHLTNLLGGLVSEPSARLADLPFLSASERAALEERAGTRTSYPRDATIHELFEAQAARLPDAVAVVFEDEELTYRELHLRAIQLAHRLQAQGVRAETPVGLNAHRSLELVIATIAILEAGGAYVPLDPELPESRLAWTLEDAGISVVVRPQSLPAVGSEAAHVLEAGCTSTSLAYVMYTSGSTGVPKGVGVPHRAVVRLVHGASFMRFGEDEVSLQLAPFAFDASTLEIWGALLHGGRLVVFPRELPSPDRIAELLARHGVTTLWLTAGLFNQMIEQRPDGLRGLRQLLTGGEALSVAHVGRALAELPEVALLNGYGPTEDTTFTCCHAVGSASGPSIPIGRPISNTLVYVLDDDLQPVPIGVPGELYAGGDGVARGYLGRPDLTAERFLPDPFCGDPEARLYRTGDLVRWSADGALSFVGRRDLQIKLRGYRIELGEIEAVLGAHPDLASCAVVVREDAPGDRRLVGYVVGRAGRAPEATALRAYLAERLPEYMAPSSFVVLEALPLTPNGKVDRRALPAPKALSERPFVAPRGPVEEAVASVFAEVLRVDRVGAHDGFFELGGHSLLATQAVARLRGLFGVALPLRAIFESPSPSELAASVEEALREGRRDQVPPPAREPRGGASAPSFGQERLWFLSQLDPSDPSYVVSLALRLEGHLNIVALRGALQEIVRRHEVLRTTLVPVGGRPVQLIQDVAVSLPVASCAELPAEDREAVLLAEALVETQRPFDLAAGPMLRVRLLELDVEDHVLFLTLHHVVFDAWSLGVLYRELSVLYAASCEGRRSPLAELSFQYADHAAWERRRLSGASLEGHLAYWKTELDGAPHALDLPADRPRPGVRSSRGAQVRFELASELLRALAELSRQEGATLFMTLLAGFEVLLHRYTGANDLLVGTPSAGRTHAETEQLIGFFLNTLVLRARLAGVETFRELLRHAREVCLRAYAHQEMPFERLVQELHVEPDPSRSPVFQVIFNLQNTPAEALELPGLRARRVAALSTTVKVDLTLIMSERDGRLGGLFEYSTDLFERSTIERLAEHFCVLLAAAAERPSASIRRLPLLSERERRRLLLEWNRTEVAQPAGEVIHGMFEVVAAGTPDAVAVVAGDEALTFGALDRLSNRLAGRLRSLGVGPDGVVGLLMSRSAEAVIGLLGILKAGGGYLPLDPAHPRARHAQLMADTGATVVVTREAEALEGARWVRVGSELAEQSDARVESGARPEHLVYVLFTSGSTGRPKGVAVEHRNLVNYVRGVASRLGLPRGASYAHVSTFAADLGNTALYLPLCLGGTLHEVSDDLAVDPDGLAAHFDRSPVDCLKIAPSHLGALLLAGHPEKVLPRGVVVVGGEGLTWELVERVERLAPGTRVCNHYSPTEATCGVLTYFAESRRRTATPIAPLGRPLPNARIYLLDEHGEPVPTGVPGELYVAGAGVTRGYLGRADLTAERFLRDPFVADPAARMYKSGDRARHLPDGNIVFLGRLDFQVKVRGFRVELGEVEAALLGDGAVREAVVIARDESLVAFVAPVEAVDPNALRASLAERLPDYMIPASIVALPALPLTPNGKVDRGALAALEVAKAEGIHVAPRTPVEEVLAGIWADVFGREHLGIHERFADLGGHSLLAIQIVARAREAFQVALPLRDIFEAPTIAGLAERVESALREGTLERVPPPIARAPRDKALPLSFAQERLWFLAQLDPDNTSYNVPARLRLRGQLDAGVLERALLEIVRRHEVLRTTFASIDGKAAQVIHDRADLRVPVERVASMGATLEEAAAEAVRPFDLADGPLFRARLLCLAPDDHVLLLTMHHIVSDAWAKGVLYRELAALYEAFSAGRPSPLAELGVQYADYAVWQRGWLLGAALEARLAYWKAELSGAPAGLELFTDRPRPPVFSGRGSWRRFAVAAELVSAARALCRRQGTTLFMMLLAVFDALLHRYTGQGDLVVGTPIAGRLRPEVEPLIGFFANTLAIRAGLTPELSFFEVLARVRESCLGAYAHQEVPFERIVTELAPERDLSRSPLFQVMFTFQDAPPAGVRLPGLSVCSVDTERTTSKFDLTLSLEQGPAGLQGVLEYAVDLYDAATAERMTEHYQVLLEAATASPDKALGDLPVMRDAERVRVLVGWNDTVAVYPEHRCVHELFEEQAARTPEATALVLAGHCLTYRALDEQSNRLARRLRGQGVGPEKVVGVCLSRSPQLVIAMLGAMKAGGVYAPLDPASPAQRLAFMTADANAVVRIDEHSPLWDDLEAERGAPLGPLAGLGNAAYVIYTSGSTGRPKGVVVEHAGLVNLAVWHRRTYAVTALDRATLLAAPGFDASVWEMWPYLISGASLSIPDETTRSEPRRLVAWLTTERITLAFLPTPLAEAVLAEAWPSDPALRVLLTGGDRLRVRPPAGLGLRLVNHYGPTENTVVATAGEVLPEGDGTPSIGRPISNVGVYLLDAQQSPVPQGVPGELCLGGVGLSRGYLSRPDLTAERFVPSGLPEEPGARLYRTGDLCRYRVDGSLEYLGRTDQQVKVRGYRVELGEIEAVVGQHPSVREAVVVVREDSPGMRRLVAYLVARSEGLTVNALRDFVGEKLPDSLVPSAFVVLEAMPLTGHGKVDRRALPVPEEGERLDLGEPFTAPRTDVEAELARIWAAVLRLPRVGVHDNFFAAGGDSILTIQIVARARDAGVVLTPRQMFQHQTIAELAGAAGTTGAVDAVQGPVTGPLSPVPIQAWWIEQETAEPHHHNQAMMFEVRAALAPHALEAAVAALLVHHDMLRVRLSARGEATIAPPGEPPPVSWVDVSLLARDAQTRAVEQEAASVQASLDLLQGPAMRVVLFELGAGAPGRLLIVVHHLAIDGVSWRILLQDLWSACQAEGLPPKTTSFQRWAEELWAYARSGALRDEERFWLAVAERGGARLPRDRAGDNLEGTVRMVVGSLDAKETDQLLREVPGVYRTQMTDVLLAAFACATAPWVGPGQLVVDLEGHGREELFEDADVTRTLGWFTALFPVVLDLAAVSEAGQAITAVKEQLRSIPNHGVGYGLLRYLGPDKSIATKLAAMPAAEVSFNYLGQLDQALPAGSPFAFARESPGLGNSPRARRPYLLDVQASVRGGVLRVRVGYSEACHQRETIEALVERFVSALRGMIAHCLSPEAGGYTPSDFQKAELTQEDIGELLDLLDDEE